MATWTEEELKSMSEASDLFISIQNEDGSMHKPTFIWGVVADNQLYCRGYSGVNAAWYVSAKREGMALISIGGITKKVHFKFINDPKLAMTIDAAYQARFRGNEYLNSILTRQAQEATVKIIPY